MGLQPTHAAAAATLMNEPMTPERRLKMARFIMQIREDCACPEFPQRPTFLTMHDSDLVDAYQEAQAGASVSRDKERALAYLGQWREAVRSAEGIAQGRLATLLLAARIFTDRGMGDEADFMLTFAEDEYPSFRRKEVPDTDNWVDLRNWCLKCVMNFEVLPRHLRAMRQPDTGGAPWR